MTIQWVADDKRIFTAVKLAIGRLHQSMNQGRRLEQSAMGLLWDLVQYALRKPVEQVCREMTWLSEVAVYEPITRGQDLHARFTEWYDRAYK